MAFTVIPDGDVDAKSPIDETLMKDGFRDNATDHETRVTALEASGGGGAGITIAEALCELEHLHGKGAIEINEQTLCESYTDTQQEIKLFLMLEYPGSDTDIFLGINPIFLEAANPDSNFVAYTNVAGITNINTETSSHKIGTSALSFDVDGTVTKNILEFDVGAGNGISVSNNRTYLAIVDMPGITSLSEIGIRVSDSSTVVTNYAEFRESTQSDGSEFASGENIILIDLDRTPDAVAGTEWDPSKVIRAHAPLIETSLSSQTFVNIIWDSINFSADGGELVPTYEQLVNLGEEYTFANSSNRENKILDSGGTERIGLMTLASAMANTFAGGAASTGRRTTLKNVDQKLEFNEDDSQLTSGDVANDQEFRSALILPASVSNATLAIRHSYNTIGFFVKAKPSGTTFTAESADFTANFKNTDVFVLFDVSHVAGRAYYKKNATDFTLTADSTFSSPDMTFTVADSSALVIGKSFLIKKNEVEIFKSLVAENADESFGSALTFDNWFVRDVGLPIPKKSALFARWLLGGSSPALNRNGPGADLTITGTIPSFTRTFFDNQFGSGVFADANRYELSGANSGDLDPDTLNAGSIAGHIWVFMLDNTPAATRAIINKKNSASTQGWGIFIGTGGLVTLQLNASVRLTSAQLPQDTWSLLSFYIEDTVESRLMVNGIELIDTGGFNMTAAGASTFFIGRSPNAGQGLIEGYLAEAQMLSGNLGNAKITIQDHVNMYLGGTHAVLGQNRTSVIQDFQEGSLTGQKMSLKVRHQRRANTIDELFASRTTMSKIN